MNDNRTISHYMNNVRRHIAQYLRPGIGISCKIYPVIRGGAIIEMEIGDGMRNGDNFEPVSDSIAIALQNIRQRAFGGDLRGFRFSGTNLIMEDNRIIIIKGEDDESHWTDSSALEDVRRILPKQ